MAKYKVILDTNVVISGLSSINKKSPNREVLLRWKNKEFILQYSEDILIEYLLKFDEL